MIQKAIITQYSDGSTVMSNIRNKKGIPVIGGNNTYTATKVSEWYDGSNMDDSKVDGVIYQKDKSTKSYWRINLPNWGQTFLQKPNMQSMRDMSATEILLLKMGYYKGVNLLGYYAENGGDTPASIEYILSNTSETDDGGSVIEVGGVKLEHNFDFGVVSSYFGCKGDGTAIDNDAFIKLSNYTLNKNLTAVISGEVLLKNTTTTLLDINVGNMTSEDGSLLIIDGRIRLNTSSCEDLKVYDINIETRNFYGSLTSYDGFGSIIYSNSTSSTRRVFYNNINLESKVPDLTGAYRSNTFIQENGFSFGGFYNIKTYNVEGGISLGAVTKNIIIDNINTVNSGFSVWIQEGASDFKITNVKLFNTPQQANNWTNKNATTPRQRNGFDTLLIDGDYGDISNIYAYNPIERCIYCKASHVNAYNLYCLNGDGFKFVGKSESKISKNINISGTTLVLDDSYEGTYNFSHSHIYWVDSINITDVTIINNSTNKFQYMRSFGQLEYTASNVTISDVKVIGKGFSSSFLWLVLPKDTRVDYTVWKNIKIYNCDVFREGNRQTNSLFSRITSGANPTALTSIVIDGLEVFDNNFQYSQSSQKDDFIYSWEGVKNMRAYGNKTNSFGYFNAGFLNFNTVYNSNSENIFIKEMDLKFGHLDNAFNRLNEFVLAKGSQLKFTMDNNIELEWFYTNTGSGLNNAIKTMVFRNRTYGIINIANHNAFIESVDSRGYSRGQIVAETKTDTIGVLPNTVGYATPNLTIRGDLLVLLLIIVTSVIFMESTQYM